MGAGAAIATRLIAYNRVEHSDAGHAEMVLHPDGGSSIQAASPSPASGRNTMMMSDSLERQRGQAYERGFYQDVIAHHREGIAMIDSFLPQLRNDSVRAMAEKMKTDQVKEVKEIQEFAAKAGS